MFINYLRLNLIRFFKGRSARLAILISVAFILLIYAYIGIVLLAAKDSINMMIDGREDIGPAAISQVVLMGTSFFYVPVATGVVGSGFICSYYTFKSYYNLEIGMRNKTLFCISEYSVLVILCLILTLITTFGMLAMEPFIPSGNSMMADGNEFWFLVTFGMEMMIGLNDCSNALLSAKLFRKTGKSILFFLFYWASTLVLSAVLTNVLPTKYQIFNLILFPTFINWFANDTPIFLQNVASNKYIMVFGLVIKIIVQMALSVMLFNRKVEEKRV